MRDQQGASQPTDRPPPPQHLEDLLVVPLQQVQLGGHVAEVPERDRLVSRPSGHNVFVDGVEGQAVDFGCRRVGEQTGGQGAGEEEWVGESAVRGWQSGRVGRRQMVQPLRCRAAPPQSLKIPPRTRTRPPHPHPPPRTRVSLHLLVLRRGGGLAQVPDDELSVVAHRPKQVVVARVPGHVLHDAQVPLVDVQRAQLLRHVRRRGAGGQRVRGGWRVKRGLEAGPPNCQRAARCKQGGAACIHPPRPPLSSPPPPPGHRTLLLCVVPLTSHTQIWASSDPDSR